MGGHVFFLLPRLQYGLTHSVALARLEDRTCGRNGRRHQSMFRPTGVMNNVYEGGHNKREVWKVESRKKLWRAYTILKTFGINIVDTSGTITCF